jgi:MarR family 2-MHQ and catechol resistance regulon transcriptional repressor
MNMKTFKEFTPNKFLVVLGKMEATVLGQVEKHIKTLGYNTSEFLIMYAIAEHGALSIQDIAARISVTSGNMTYTINKLEQKGYLRRIQCSEDKRRFYVDFTDEGLKNWNVILEEHATYLNDLFKNIDETVMLETIQYMKQIGKTLQ